LVTRDAGGDEIGEVVTSSSDHWQNVIYDQLGIGCGVTAVAAAKAIPLQDAEAVSGPQRATSLRGPLGG